MKVCWVLLVCCLLARWQHHAQSRSMGRRSPPSWLTGKLPVVVEEVPGDSESSENDEDRRAGRHADVTRQSRSPPSWLTGKLPVVVEELPESESSEEDDERREVDEDEQLHIVRRDVPPINFTSPFNGSMQTLCFDCDTKCKEAIVGDVGYYFHTVVGEINDLFEDIGIEFEYQLFMTGEVQMLNPDDPVDTTQSILKFVDLMKSYWVDSGRAYMYHQNYSCDINILVGKDKFFDTYSSITGITYFMSLCTNESVIVEKLIPDAEFMGSGLAHEIGHMMGIVHTGDSIGPYYVGYPKVEGQCPQVSRPTCGMEHNFRDLCIMVTALPTGTRPNEFSDCSKTQVQAFHKMREQVNTQVYPYYREMAECVPILNLGNGHGPPDDGSG